MKTLKTYGSPYEEFCKTYKKETLTKNNTPKAHIRYGAEFAKEINKDLLCVRIMPMERHTVLHKEHRLDEEQRYPLCSIFKDEKGFYTEYEFANEQQYSVSIEYNGEVVTRTHIYAVDSDLSVLKC